jgi:APA family basic amino acid/polyamine antiporter
VAASNLLLEYTLSGAAIARSFTSYTGALVNGEANLLRISMGSEYFLLDLPALGAVVSLSVLLAAGTRGGAAFNTGVTILNLAVIVFVFFAGIPHFKWSNFRPFLPFGMRGAFSGASKVPSSIALFCCLFCV